MDKRENNVGRCFTPISFYNWFAIRGSVIQMGCDTKTREQAYGESRTTKSTAQQLYLISVEGFIWVLELPQFR